MSMLMLPASTLKTREVEATVITLSLNPTNESKMIQELTIFPEIISSLYRIFIEEYHSLYKFSRLETLKALNESHQIEIAESVKLKILFSIVVVSIVSSLCPSYVLLVTFRFD